MLLQRETSEDREKRKLFAKKNEPASVITPGVGPMKNDKKTKKKREKGPA